MFIKYIQLIHESRLISYAYQINRDFIWEFLRLEYPQSFANHLYFVRDISLFQPICYSLTLFKLTFSHALFTTCFSLLTFNYFILIQSKEGLLSLRIELLANTDYFFEFAILMRESLNFYWSVACNLNTHSRSISTGIFTKKFWCTFISSTWICLSFRNLFLFSHSSSFARVAFYST